MLIYLQMIETEDDRSKFEKIYEEYRDFMYHVAYKYLRQAQDAEDVVHYAFVKIAENIKKIEPPCPKTKSLVVTIVENRSIDLLRKRGRHPELGLEETWLPAKEEDVPGENLLAACILQLPDAQRQVILLKYQHGYTLKEIAKHLGRSLAWAQKTDQRAKEALKKLYTERGGTL